MSRFLKGMLAAAVLASPAAADGFGLGREATPEEVAAWDIDIRPDGRGLPVGSGDVFTGEEVYVDRCASCHGDFGEAVDRWPVLAGGDGTLASEDPVKTVGSYWPYLSTVWDYVHRAMPFGDAQSLTDDEVYAITAYILYLNDLVDDDFELSHENFAEVRLPNEEGFHPDDRMETAVWAKREVCMENCKDAVEITARAAVIDVTPEDAAARQAAEAAAGAETVDVAAVEPAAPALDPAMVAHGEKVFKKCASCHEATVEKHRAGPHLVGIFGRPAAGSEDFKKYSKSMRKLGEEGLVWDDATMAEFLAKPRAMVKKTRMSFAGLKKEEDIAALLAYLHSLE